VLVSAGAVIAALEVLGQLVTVHCRGRSRIGPSLTGLHAGGPFSRCVVGCRWIAQETTALIREQSDFRGSLLAANQMPPALLVEVEVARRLLLEPQTLLVWRLAKEVRGLLEHILDPFCSFC
jgi:hypothetical protein